MVAGNQLSEKSKGTEEDDSSAILEIPGARSFIHMMLEKGIQTLIPATSFERGIIYPEASRFLREKSDSEVAAFLAKLAGAGLLDAKTIDRIISCPSCKGEEIYTKYRCDKCGSFDISNVEIIEHKLCGYIGAKSGFLAPISGRISSSSTNLEMLSCPKCKRKLRLEHDYRELGKTFECASCLSHSENAPIVHRCEDCGTFFTYREADYLPVYEYTMTAKAKEIFSSGLLSLAPVADWLRRQGFQVELSKEITGKSGARHRFDLVASAGARHAVLLCDFALAADTQVIVALFAKRYDVNPEAKSFVVTYTSPAEDVEILSKTYGISVISIGESSSSSSLERQLSPVIAGTPQIPPSETTSMLSPLQVVDAAQAFERSKTAPLVRAPARRKNPPAAPKASVGKSPKARIAQKVKEREEEKTVSSASSSSPYYFQNDFADEEDVYLS